LPRHLVERKHVLRQLDSMLDRRAGAVRAFPGAGKTVALTCWARTAPVPVRWLRLDASDNEPAQLWADLAAALHVDADIVERYLPDTGAMADALIDLVARSPDPLWLVLDDVDRVTRSALRAGLDIILEHAENLHLVLSMRRRPELRGIGHLRLIDEIVEIGNEHLRMDEAEALELVSSIASQPIDNATVASIVNLTEGWAAGIAMVASDLHLESLEAGLDRVDIAREFPSVSDYFQHQLRTAVSADHAEFLHDTAVLDTLDPEMCDAVTARDDSAHVCHALERDGAFVTRLDTSVERYRLHSLFRRTLARDLARRHPDRMKDIHRAAATWLAARGEFDRAFGHWLDAGDVDRAWATFRERNSAYLSPTARAQLSQWADVLERAADVTGANKLDLALALLLVGETERATPWIARAEAELEANAADRRPEHPDAERSLGMLALTKFLHVLASGDLVGALAAAGVAQDRLERTMPGGWWRLRGPLWQSLVHAVMGDTKTARRLVSSLVADLDEWTLSDHVTVLGVRACIALEEGALTRAAEFASEGLAAATDLADPTAPLEAHVRWAQGALALEQNRLDDAEADLERAVALGERSGFVPSYVLPGIDLAYLRYIRGDADTARSMLTRFDDLTRRWNPSPLNERTIEQWARLALLEDDTDAVALLSARLTGPRRSFLLAELHAATGDAGKIRDELARGDPRNASLRRRLIELLVNAQIANTDAGRTELVHAALTLAEPEGYVRLFADRARWIVAPLERLVADWPTSYVSDLLGAIASTPSRATPKPAAWPLSEREHDVWRHLGTRLSTREIGARLGVSHNTVKTHMRSIYRKLGVRTRKEAVARGRAGAGPVSG
jgi:LuxR family maltose regulon positive regulatory protein